MIALALALLQLASSQPDAPSPASLVDQLKCTPFEWAAQNGRERAVLNVPVVVDGRSMTFQLDTASEVSIFYGRQGAVVTPSAGGIELQPMYFAGMPNQLGDGGTLGLDVFVGRAAVIDYPRQRFCLMSLADFPYPIYRRTKWTDVSLRSGRLFVPVTLNGELETNFFFDTGASSFPVSMDMDLWMTVTGLTSPEDAATIVEGKAWGQPIRLVGAPLTGGLSIAGSEVVNPVAFAREDQPRFFADTHKDGAGGLIGNAGVWDKVVVIYLGSRPRFGFLE